MNADILDDLLVVAITEMQEKNATVVGVVSTLIERALDICTAIRRQELWRLVFLRRSTGIDDPETVGWYAAKLLPEVPSEHEPAQAD